MTKSAGDHEWHEVVVHIFPTVTGARYAVITRKKKGAATVWHRDLCVGEVAEADWETMGSLAGVLEACGAALTTAAQRARRQAPGSDPAQSPA